MKRWRCRICAYVHRGDEPPAKCPVCEVGPEFFERLPDEDLSVQAGEAPSAVVVIGNGVAGHHAALALRRTTRKSQIKVLTDEPHPFYSRMSLTPYVAGEISRDDLSLFDEARYAEQDIDLVLGQRVARIDRRERVVVTDSGRELPYDRLVITTGAAAGRPPIPGIDQPKVVVLRTLDDAEHLISLAPELSHVVVLGGGLLGLESAYALKARAGCRVTVLEMAPRLLPRQLDSAAAALLETEVARKGIEVRTGIGVEGFGDSGGEGPLEVNLAGGAVVGGDLVVVAAGIRPNLGLAKAAGLETNLGVMVDDGMRTSDRNIFAAGDVAEHRGALYGIWPTAMSMGDVAGANAGGAALTLETQIAATFLKVLGIPVFSAGRAAAPPEGSRALCSHERENGLYRKLVIHEGRVVGGILLGTLEGSTALSAAVESAHEVDLPSDLDQEKEQQLLMEILSR